MKLLLDTHTFLWWLQDKPILSQEVKRLIGDHDNQVYVSAANIWEIAIKVRLGKLEVDGDVLDEIGANGFLELPITAAHAQTAGSLPRYHDDPFDRMLIAQASREGMVLVTRDNLFGPYAVATLNPTRG